MTTKKNAKPTAKKPKAKPAKPKKTSALDAAAQVLAEFGGSMTTREMIEAMAAKKLWQSPNGKTPAATLYSAILREVTTKGTASRFKKTEPGQFAATGAVKTAGEKPPVTKSAKTAKPKAAKGTKATGPSPVPGGTLETAGEPSAA